MFICYPTNAERLLKLAVKLEVWEIWVRGESG